MLEEGNEKEREGGERDGEREREAGQVIVGREKEEREGDWVEGRGIKSGEGRRESWRERKRGRREGERGREGEGERTGDGVIRALLSKHYFFALLICKTLLQKQFTCCI